MKKQPQIISLAALLLVLGGCYQGSLQQLPRTVTIGGHEVSVTEAVTIEQQSNGLSGVRALPEDHGMLFTFKTQGYRSFWMKGMYIPIDIIWIRDGQIVGIEKSVQPPATNASDSVLTTYRSPMPVDHVLEVNAGFSDAAGLKIGDELKIR